MNPDGDEVKEAMQVFLDSSLPELEGMEQSLLNKLGSAARKWGPKWAIDVLLKLVVSRMLAQKRQYTCPLTDVSTIIRSEVSNKLKVYGSSHHAHHSCAVRHDSMSRMNQGCHMIQLNERCNCIIDAGLGDN